MTRSILFLTLFGAAPLSRAQIPAFPGAEGYGAYATGGRGGDVYTVTNLNSSGAGSLYDGLTTIPAAGRTIVFAVSGQIHLAGGIATRITGNKLTIAGQTAPGDGILLKDGTLRISGDDIVIRHLRFRHGKYGSGGDCIDLDSGSRNAILDHVSMSFSTDENISSFGSPPENLTLQWSFNAWGLESHSCGGLWDQNHATCHHSLWAHNHTRNPKARPNGLLEWSNNITFDWDIGFIMGDSQTPAAWKANVTGNYFICPPGNIRNTPLEKASLDRNGVPNFSVWVAGNLHDRDGNGILDGTDRGWAIVSGSAYDTAANPAGNYYKLPAAAAGSGILSIDAPLLAYKKTVSAGGPLRPDFNYSGALRDEVDTRLIQNLVTQTANHITRESDLAGVGNGGFGTFAASAAPIDSDRDGMPDSYENALGWNGGVQDHNTAVSGASFFPAGTPAGYTRLEEYLHFKSVPHLQMLKNTATSPDIDLARYTAGFTDAPVFTLAGVTGGTATQSGAGGCHVHFTAAASAGRGGFLFTVTDAAGDSWTQQFAILVANSGAPAELNWRGSGSTWDTSAQNWLKNGVPTAFGTGDRVTFNSAGAAAPAVSVPAGVAAGSMDVNGPDSYVFSGAGPLNCSGALTKRGSGTLTFNTSGTNGFGSVDLLEGALVVNNAGATGGAAFSFNGGSLTLAPASNASLAGALAFNRAAAITIGSQHAVTGNWSGAQEVVVGATSGQLWTIAGTWTDFSGRLRAGSGNPRFRINGNSNLNFGSSAVAVDLGTGSSQLMNRNGATIALGELSSGSPATGLSGTQTGTAPSTYVIGGRNTDAMFAGGIFDGGGTTAITKTGSGAWTLTGASTHTGATTVSQGSLFLNGTFSGSPVTVASGATLGGTGSSGAAVTVSAGATLAPGVTAGAAGVFTASNGLTLAGRSAIDLDLSGSLSGPNDRITVTSGTLSLASPLTVNLRMTDGALASGAYRFIDGNAIQSGSGISMILTGVPSGTRQTFSLARQAAGATPAFVELKVGGTPPASLVWSGPANGGVWDLATTGNFTGGATPTFYNLDRVTFNDTSTVGSVNLTGILEPASVTVANNPMTYVFSGTGGIGGKTALVKSGSGTLTLSPAIASAATTSATGSASATVTDASQLAVGMAVLGGGFPYGTTITALSGNTLTLSAASTAGVTSAAVTYQARNSYSGGTALNGGTIQLGNEAGNRWGLGSGPVVFGGGVLKLYDSGTGLPGAGDFPNALAVPAGQTGTLHTPQRGSLSGTLTGGGTLNVVVRYVRGDFYGDWSAFTGAIQVSAATGSEFRLAENYSPDGFPNAVVHIGASVTMKHVGILSGGAGTTIPVGALNGASGAWLQGGITGGRALTYRVGGKGVDAAFNGTIAEQSAYTLTNFVKTGAAVWTLGGTGNWAGGTGVEQGTLRVTGTMNCGGSTYVSPGATLDLAGGSFGTESAAIGETATLNGDGVFAGDLGLSGTCIGRGYATGLPGTLAINGSAFMESGSVCKLLAATVPDRITVAGDLSLSGTIEINPAPGLAFGRYRLIAYGGALTGSAALAGAPASLEAHLSTSVPGGVDLVVDDADEDGLPDTWESARFGNLAQGPADDADKDGSSNLSEYRLNLDPTNGASAFRATVTSPRTLTWPSAPGIVFTVRRSLTLEPGSWVTLASVPAAAGTATSFTDPASFARAFYRVEFTP